MDQRYGYIIESNSEVALWVPHNAMSEQLCQLWKIFVASNK